MGGPYIDTTPAKKVFRIKKALVGCAGNVPDIIRFRQYLKDNEPFEVKGDIDALVVRDGQVYWYDHSLVPVPCGTPAAAGSGAAFAMGAMLAGASAKQAVEIATRLDECSGGKVQTKKC